jgi:hypothetical protein
VPDDEETQASRKPQSSLLIAIAAASVVLAVSALNFIDGVIARRLAPQGTAATSLAIAASSAQQGLASGVELRCGLLLVEDRLRFFGQYASALTAAGSTDPLAAPAARAARSANLEAQETGTKLFRPIPRSLGLDPHAVDAFEHARCDEKAIEENPAVALVRNQNRAAARSSELQGARGRVTLGLTLVAIAAALFAVGQPVAGKRAGRAVGWTGSILLGAAVLWGVSALAV